MERVIEVTTDSGYLVVTPREQVDSEQVGVPGGQRSDLAQAEQQEASLASASRSPRLPSIWTRRSAKPFQVA